MTTSLLLKGSLKAPAMALILLTSGTLLSGCGGGSSDMAAATSTSTGGGTGDSTGGNTGNDNNPPAHNLSLTSQPSSATIYEGQSRTFSLAASSNYPVTISWYKNGSLIAGANGTSYTVSNASTGSAGTYSCAVTDGTLTVNCNSFSLAVNQIVRITTQPSNQAVNAGVNVALNVAATGTGPLSYQWFFNSQAITGATTSQLSLNDISTTNAGSYYCVVTNAGSTATSSNAIVAVAGNAAGSAQISWSAPTTRADGSTLSSGEISGYQLFYSTAANGEFVQLMTLSSNELSVVVDELDSGTHYFALATLDSEGLSSDRSPTFSVSIN